MLEEENYNLLEKVCSYFKSSIFHSFSNKILLFICWHLMHYVELVIQLQLAEERCKEAEARSRELEKQVIVILLIHLY